MRRAAQSVGAIVILVAAILAIRLTAGTDIRYVVLACAVTLGSMACVALHRLDYLRTPGLLVVAIGLRLLLIDLPPVYSDDAFRYLWDGELVSQGASPYQSLPDEVEHQTVLQAEVFDQLNSKSYYSVYPPVSQYVFATAVKIGRGQWEQSYLALKLLLSLFEVAALVLFARFVSRPAFLLYALNPLVIFEVAGQAHTESIVLPFLVGSILLAHRRYSLLSGSMLGISALVKLYPALLLPFVARRLGWRSAVGFSVAIIGLSVPFLNPDNIFHGVQSLKLYVRLFEFNAGPYLLMKWLLGLLTGIDWSKQLGPLLAIAAAAIIIRYYRRTDERTDLSKVAVSVFTILILFATTVHPWYLVPLLAVIAIDGRPHWHWQWLSAASAGTYLLYSDGPYWPFVIVGWTGAAILFVWSRRHQLLNRVMRKRGRDKAQRIAELAGGFESGRTVVDIGAAEGHVAQALCDEYGIVPTLVDVVDMNATTMPLTLTSGTALPFKDNAFDYGVLCFVLHHATDQDAVLKEASRVCTRSIFILESTYHSVLGHRFLIAADKIANRMRSGGAMKSQESHLHFRSVSEWETMIRSHGLEVATVQTWGSPLHRQVAFVVNPLRSATASTVTG